jgi:hypothetical protein
LAALGFTCAYAGHLERSTHPVVIAALVACVLTVLAGRGGQRGESVLATTEQATTEQALADRPQARRSGSGAVPLVAAMAAIGVAAAVIAPLAEDADRLALRDLYDAPLRVEDAVSPLTQVSAVLGAPSGGDRTAFRVTFEGIPAGTDVDRVSVAVLDHFDGSVWTNTARFDRAGRTLPDGWATAPAGPEVRQHTNCPAAGRRRSSQWRVVPSASAVSTPVGSATTVRPQPWSRTDREAFATT